MRLDDQPDTYLYGFRRLGHPIISVIYNVVRKPKLRQGKNETADIFIKRVQKALLEDSKLPLADRKYYLREKINRSSQDLIKYEEEIKRVTSDMENYMVYRSPKRCNFMYGEKCPFIPLCEGGECEDMFRKKTALHEEYKEGK